MCFPPLSVLLNRNGFAVAYASVLILIVFDSFRGVCGK